MLKYLKPKTTKKINKKGPYFKSMFLISKNLSDNNEKRIFEPSRGGIGIRLKKPNNKL